MPTRASASISSMPRPRALEGRVDVVDRVGDVVQAGALRCQELANRRLGAERRQQLDVAVADVEQRRLDSLGLDRLA